MSIRIKLILVALCALVILSPVPLHAWQLESGDWIGVPSGIPFQPLGPAPAVDLDGDGLHEIVRLENHQASVWQAGLLRWESPAGWQVQQVEIADLTRDRIPELVLLVWRPFAPWPIDRFIPNPGRIQDFQTPDGLSCHLILIGWERGAYRERWAGSALARPLHAMSVIDLDGDGRLELAATETSYSDPFSDKAESLSAWQWNGFGFSLIDRQDIPSHRLVAGYTQSGLGIIVTGP